MEEDCWSEGIENYSEERARKLDEIRPFFEAWRKVMRAEVSDYYKKKATEKIVNLIMELEIHEQSN